MVLTGSVGANNATNNQQDVNLVQTLLKKIGAYDGVVGAPCGPETIEAIKLFQRTFMNAPDGRIDVNGRTWVKLSDPNVQPLSLKPGTTKPDWSGDSSRWTQEKKLASLDTAFQPKVERILQALRDAGFQPKIFFGWRSVQVQLELVKKGNSKIKFSFHNAQKPDGTPNAFAVDIVDSRWGWEDEAERNGFWAALGQAARAEGCVWGGDWTTFKDVAHVQDKQNSELAMVKKASGL